MKLLNVQTGQIEEYTPDQTAFNLAAGTHVPTENKGVLFNPNGQLVFVPDYQVSDAVTKYNYKIPEPQELQQYGERYKYATPEMELGAFAAGLGRGAFFGATDFLATQSKLVAPETLRKMQEYSPFASAAGEVTGVIGSSFIPFSPVAKVASGAKKLEDISRAALAARLPANTMAKKITELAIETGVKGLGGIVEGSAFGLGQTVSEASLGDEELTAQKVFAGMGQGAFLGGALNAALVPGRLILEKSLNQAKKAYTGLKEWAVGKYVPIEGAVNKAEVDAVDAAITEGLFDPNAKPTIEQFVPGKITGIWTKGKAIITGQEENEILEGLQRVQGQKYITAKDLDLKAKELRESVNEIYQSTEKALSKITGVVRPQEIENLLVGTPIQPAKATFDNFIRESLEQIAAMQSEEFIHNKAIYKTFEKKLLGFAQRAGYSFQKTDDGLIEIVAEGNKFTKTADYFNTMNELKREVDDLSGYGSRLKPSDKLRDVYNTEMIMRDLGGKLRKNLENPEIFGESAARQQAINEAISQYKRIVDKDSFFATKFLKGPEKKRYVDATKTKQFMRFINDDRGEFGRLGLSEFLNSTEKLIQQLDNTVKNAPTEAIDTAAIKAFINKSAIKATQAKDYVQSFEGGLGYITDIMERAAGGNFGGAASVLLQGLADPTTATTSLSQIEKFSARITKEVDKKSKAIFEKVRVVPKIGGRFAPKAGGLIQGETEEERKERYKENTDRIKDLTGNPEKLLNMLEKATENSFNSAPKISEALQMLTMQSILFLESKMPKPIHQSPLDKEYEPSQSQMIKYLRYDEAVETPLVVLDQLENNYVLPETVETLQALYPKLYNDIRVALTGQLIDRMSEKDFKLPYQKRIVLSKFLDFNLDSTMLPEIINRNQETLAKLAGEAEKDEEAQDQAMRTSQSGASKLSLASRNQTAITQTMTRA